MKRKELGVTAAVTLLTCLAELGFGPARAKTPVKAAARVAHCRTATLGGMSLPYREAGPPDAPVVLLLHRKLISTEEKRRGVEALGAEMVGRLSYYERWATACAVLLFQKGILTPTGLAEKMKDIEARWSAGNGPADAAAT